ncbi:MAG: DUF1634 domain-containing protein [Planctomycetota bacterium]
MARAARLTTWGVGLAVAVSLACFALTVGLAPPGALGVVPPASALGGALRLDPAALASVGVLALLLSPVARLIGAGVQLRAEGHPRLALGAALILALLVFSLGRLALTEELGAPRSSTAPVTSEAPR